MIPDQKDYYKTGTIDSVKYAPDAPIDTIPRVLPRQVSTGITRGIQTIGFGPDALDGPNNRIILSGQTIFIDPTDNTKILQFSMSSITTGTTRTITIPDSSGVMVVTSSLAYTTFTPAPAGYSGTPTTTVARYNEAGHVVNMDISITGTSNATTLTFTLPVAPKTAASYPIIVTDNGTVQADPGLLIFTAASTTATCYKTLASGAFTNSGTKAFSAFGITYEAN